MTVDVQKGQLKKLPDYTTLKKFAEALWQENPSFHGAAIMVGAGFSRSGAETAVPSKKMPLWYDFTKVLQSELGSSDASDPLRIAEEYKAFFGNQALSQLIRREIDDLAWQPGELYTTLLELPWKEVLTTNWDTLLERKAEKITDVDYSIVNRGNDLARSASPRITKLHGTIGVTDELVFTQEEYRQYPVNHAAFVNFARQVFIENELCLLGFSGDDPNFLQWAGWVRDNLQDSARRIYLVGSLNLSPTKRKYLESINISPIDLYPIVAEFDNPERQHFEATKIFLKTLSDLKPKNSWEWKPTILSGGKLTVDEKLGILKSERLSYPGWIICPSDIRDEIRDRISHDLLDKSFLEKASFDLKASILFEQMWSFKVSSTFAPFSILESYLDIAENYDCHSIKSEQRAEFALYVLDCSKWAEDNEKLILENRATKLIHQNAKFHEASYELLKIHEAQKALYDYDFKKLKEILKGFKPSSPELKLKKATLLSQQGDFEEGKKLLEEAKSNLLEGFKKDSSSIYLLSRLNLVESILEVINWQYQKNVNNNELATKKKCSYWRQKEQFDVYVQSELDKQIEQSNISVSFEPGRYIDHSRRRSISTNQHPLLRLDILNRLIGAPIRWSDITHFGTSIKKLIEFQDIDFDDKLFLTISAFNDSRGKVVLDKILSRVAVANLSSTKCDYYISKFLEAIEFWLRQAEAFQAQTSSYLYSLGRLYLFIELLARFSIRAESEKAIELFKFSISLIEKRVVQNHLIFDSLNNLVNYSLKSTPKHFKKEAFVACLNFPLASELKIEDSRSNWPRPSVDCDLKREEFESLDHRITNLIKLTSLERKLSYPALKKLMPLVQKSFLKDEELNDLRKSLWDGCGGSFPDKGFLKWAYLTLPNNGQLPLVKEFKKEVFDTNSIEFLSFDNLLDVSNCTYAEVELSESEAKTCFTKLISWRPREDIDEIDLALFGDDSEQIGKLVTEALNNTVVKALPIQMLSQSNFDKLINFSAFPSCYKAIESLVYFATHKTEFGGKLSDLIRTKLHSSNHQSIIAAAHTIVKWRELSENKQNKELITSLIMMVSANKEASGLNILNCITRLMKNNYLSDTQKMMLSNIIPAVFGSTNYQQASFRNEELVNIPLMRVELSKLAQLLISEGESYSQGLRSILKEIKEDPLPEVRYSLHSF